jgi:glycosyltransferase involved in cell wall biosynthesis
MRAEPYVLQVLSSAGLYGAEHVVLGLIPALQGCGINGSLLCIQNPRLADQPLYERARQFGIPAETVPCRGRFDPATVRALRSAVARHPGAMVHVHGYKAAFYALLARGGRAEPSIVATLHGWVTTTHALRLYRWLELRLLRRFQCICIVSETMRATLNRAGVDDARIRLIENGIDTRRFRPDVTPLLRRDFGIPDRAFLFGCVMRLSPEKNPLGLLKAFALMASAAPHAWLAIAGDGPQRPDIEQQARDLGIAGRLRLIGERIDMDRFYPMLDCFVLPSLTEGLPLSLLEAMASARAVIASDVGQVATVLDGLPARVVPAGEVAALASAMQEAVDYPQPSRALRERVEARYSVARMARDHAALYREIRDLRGLFAA